VEGFNFGPDWNGALIAQTMLTVLTQIAREESSDAAADSTIPGVWSLRISGDPI
jgi:hypothetical protein